MGYKNKLDINRVILDEIFNGGGLPGRSSTTVSPSPTFPGRVHAKPSADSLGQAVKDAFDAKAAADKKAKAEKQKAALLDMSKESFSNAAESVRNRPEFRPEMVPAQVYDLGLSRFKNFWSKIG